MDYYADLDEMLSDFNVNDFDFPNTLKELLLVDKNILDSETVLSLRDTFTRDAKNQIEKSFVIFTVYKIIGDEELALKEIKKGHKFYLKDTIAYFWENVVYKSLRLIYGNRMLGDAILPNDRRPDIVIDPIMDGIGYHERGVKILSCDKIYDCKTSIYNQTKEKKFYQDYCNDVTFIYLIESPLKKSENFNYVSSDDLIELLIQEAPLKSESLIESIKQLQVKASFEYMHDEFHKRFYM